MKAYWFIFCKDSLVLEKQCDGTFNIPQGEHSPLPIEKGATIHHIMPMNDGTEVRTYSICEPISETDKYEMCGLRKSYYKLSAELYQKAGKCHEILYWDYNTQYCGVCGAPMKMHTDISKKCTKCGKELWPQLATAVITLIKRDDKILLVNARNFRSDFYGLVAGFVETGETLEEAAKREIKEEVGLEVKNLKYFGSQPWPYPCGLMVGFTADYVSGEIKLQQSELNDAHWYSIDNLPQIPEKLSIARKLIDAWIEGRK
jgi:NAD+ diphosphatase